MLRLLVEGWTKYPHSYCIVNVYQIIALAKLPNVKLFLKEVEPYRKEWPAFKSLAGIMLTDEEEATLKGIETYKEGQAVDVIYRISFAHNIAPSSDRTPVVVFYTAEFKKLEQVNFVASSGDFSRFLELMKKGRVAAITPSRWSAGAFSDKETRKCGNFLKVIPHGVDTGKFHPDPSGRKSLRQALNIDPTDIVYLNIGAMTGNKNIMGILKAFYGICQKKENVRLIFKGINSLYNCEMAIQGYLGFLIQNKVIDVEIFQKCVGKRITYLDGAMGYSSLRELYNAADCYVCPYIAEGFNMPALEAQACGTPVIAPSGGPTDDFMSKDCTVFLPANEVTNEKGHRMLESTLEDLTAAMMMMTEEAGADLMNKAAVVGPAFVEEKFTWDIVAKRMVKYFESLV